MNNLFVEFKIPRGRPRKYSPKELLDQFAAYLEERQGQPIEEKEEESAITSGQSTSALSKEKTKNHPQLLSIRDFCVFLGCSYDWWYQLPDDFSKVKCYISTYLENYQLKGASVGVFNANIVSRLIGLADKKEISTDGLNIIVNSEAEKKKIEDIGNLGI